jgi:SAM-dependent methyltransferase
MDYGYGSKSREDAKKFTLHHYAKTIFDKEKAYNHPFPLDIYFLPLIGEKKEVSIADIGAGMFATTGSLVEGVKINLFPSDELADQYSEELKRQNITPLFPIEKQDMENLTYQDNSFDIVHCVNALDHVINPFKAIQEMYRVCKKDGYIYLRHHFNTAKIQKGRGLHHWNMTVAVNEDVIFYGELGGFALSSCVPGFHTFIKKELDWERNDMIVSILHKI